MEQIRIGLALLRGEQLAERGGAIVRVLVARAGRTLQLHILEAREQLVGRVASIRICFATFRLLPEVRGQPRHPGRVCGQMLERDLAAIALIHRVAGRQQRRHWVFQLHHAAVHRVRQRDAREHLGDRADLENRVAVGPGVGRAGVGGAEAADPGLTALMHADDQRGARSGGEIRPGHRLDSRGQIAGIIKPRELALLPGHVTHQQGEHPTDDREHDQQSDAASFEQLFRHARDPAINTSPNPASRRRFSKLFGTRRQRPRRPPPCPARATRR